MPRKALITGISGQDGSYLTELLLSKGYEVHGILRRNSTPEFQTGRISHLLPQVQTYYGDLTDPTSLDRVVADVQPDEVYNLAGQSHVRVSTDIPSYTVMVNSIGVLNMLESVRKHAPQARFYQASSSEMFGSSIDEDLCQRELTPMHPVSPYGCAKLFGYHITRHYRTGFKLFAANGILFNHESPRRASNFVTAKVIKTAVEISLGKTSKLELGNLDSKRDWGHSRDYVRAMHLILQYDYPTDFVVATGHTHSVRELCDFVFGLLGLDYREHVVQNERLFRPQELPYLRGDATKAKTLLGWEPEISFYDLIREMVDHYKRQLCQS